MDDPLSTDRVPDPAERTDAPADRTLTVSPLAPGQLDTGSRIDADTNTDTDTDTVSFGYQNVAPAEKTARVGAVFTNVARRYDIMNDAMSGGMHRLWKDRFVRRVKPRGGEEILDMAGGTGDIAFRMAERGARVTVADINQDMLDVGLDRAVKRGIDTLVWSCQNAESLSFADQSFDAYTIAFGIRNVTHIDQALAEAYRVLRHGGRFWCLEFSTTQWAGFREVYDAYSHHLVPRIGKQIAGDADSYRYLVESIRRFPTMPAFQQMIEAAGFTQTRVEPIMGGLVAMHSGWKT
ncbi:class I SAM-dependent methyltransferase [Croceicoccus sp. F390]|uniref:Ubiquinone/menaquinone biosynthesis C-methyltransferase UbiE n=1 Tax=Croceicoccus esteveae TaxID=3075597 RepID=A0ABU2ZIB4_9SPHN|nr:class I SAM-dependent methyltransferase [Croceicoccus sp. F390]MDT0575763.1 class I SAM-dependent methyltransferase [Croceicoccus sp. F390]